MRVTRDQHLTVLNVGTEIPTNEIGNVHNTIETETSRDVDLYRRLQKACQNPELIPELLFMPDAALGFMCSGGLIDVHQLRLDLREAILSHNRLDAITAIYDRDLQQPIWIHTVFARIIAKFTHHEFAALERSCRAFQQHCQWPTCFESAQLGFLVFKDDKAMCSRYYPI